MNSHAWSRLGLSLSSTLAVSCYEVDTLLRQLVQVTAHQSSINDDLRESIREQHEFNAWQLVINQNLDTTLARLEITQARIEALLARLIRTQRPGCVTKRGWT